MQLSTKHLADEGSGEALAASLLGVGVVFFGGLAVWQSGPFTHWVYRWRGNTQLSDEDSEREYQTT
jgi:hypothetical protein